jgi:DNA processing protein
LSILSAWKKTMTERTYTDEQQCLICLSSIAGVGPVTMHKLLAGTRAHGIAPMDLFRLSAAELIETFGISPKTARLVATIPSPLDVVHETLDVLSRLEAYPLFESEEDYPKALSRSLGQAAPPIIFAMGDVRLLSERCIGIAGSRTPSEPAAMSAAAFAAAEAKSGIVIVSGGATGIDQLAHQAALSRGSTIVVPAVGLALADWRKILGEHRGEGRWCAIGQFSPTANWKNAQAMARNRTIVALSDAVVGFDPRDMGGTWRTCMACLRLRKPLFIVRGSEAAENVRAAKRLVRLGAIALDPACMPDAAEFARMVSQYRPPSHPAQSSLFEDETGSSFACGSNMSD